LRRTSASVCFALRNEWKAVIAGTLYQSSFIIR